MAAGGMRFSDHYAGSSLCAPSRCSLLTGLHTGHARIRDNAKVPLEPGDVTIAETLAEAGYVSGVFGKWGLGLPGSTGFPTEQGFDEFLGYADQSKAHFYYPTQLETHDGVREIPENRDGAREVYSHDLIADASLNFIRRHQERPFFLYIPFTIPHAEVLVPEDSLAEYRGRWEETPFGGGHYAAQPEPRAARAAMITRMDRDVGRLLDLLEELNLSERTLVIFTSDNGPITAGGQDIRFFDSAGPLRGRKFQFYEGGIRVPMVAHWPGRVPAGTTTERPSAFWDVLPTFADLAGVSPPGGIDGVSFLPTLLGRPDDQAPPSDLYWEHRGEQALRMGNWKGRRAAPGAPIELFDLTADLGESLNLADRRPEEVAKIEQAMQREHVDSERFPLQPRRR